MKYPFIQSALAAAILSTLSFGAHADMSVEERLTAMEARLNAVEAENLALKDKLKSADQKIEATGDQVEKIASTRSTSTSSWTDSTKIGGYGEFSYSNLDDKSGGGGDVNAVDFQRFVLFFGHKFNDKVSLFSELEVEHAHVEANKGELEVEQAYLDFNINDSLSAKAGIVLLPVGIMNETHEPPSFYGVNRNPVETSIIPTTWYEGGTSLTARLGSGFTLDGMISTGLNTSQETGYGIRESRQEMFEGTLGKDPAYTARLKWTGVPGLELAGTMHYQSDIAQGLDPLAGAAWLYETHAVYNHDAFGLRALYAQWDINGAGPKLAGENKQDGWYVEPSYKLNTQWGVFTRYNRWDNQAGDSADSRYSQWDIGVNYWPHPDVVLKMDYQKQQAPVGATELTGINVGIGFQF